MRIAVAQTPGAVLDNWQQTLELLTELTRQAAVERAELVLFPECVWPAYHLGSAAAYRQARERGLPSPQAFLDHLRQLARRHRTAICAGYVEEAGGQLHNSACLIDPAGEQAGHCRKLFLWDFDRDWFTCGAAIACVDLPQGRLGLLICADARVPEISATLAAQGAQLILQPTAWVNAGTPDHLWNPQPAFLISARAREFGIPFASASKWHREGDTTFVGSSLICDADGHIAVQCGQYETMVAVADVALGTPRRAQLDDKQRAMLLAPGAASAPRADVPPLVLVPLAAGSEKLPDAAWSRLTEQRGVIVGLTPPAHEPRDLRPPESRHCWLHGPAVEPLEAGGIRIAALRAAAVRSFGPARVAAMSGAHVIAFFGEGGELGDYQTRACENRVFVIASEHERFRIISPRGEVLANEGWPPAGEVTAGHLVPVMQAADKHFATGTHAFADRTPRLYAL